MTPAELIKAGNLAQARQRLVEEVKAAPADPGKRAMFCQVLCLLGEWDKAAIHLDAVALQDPTRNSGAAVYRDLIRAERERGEVFRLAQKPSFLPKAPSYFDDYWRLLQNTEEETEAFWDALEDRRPGVSGTVNGVPFSKIRDTDSFLSFFLEIMVHERYVWVPFESIRELSVMPPKTLFDTIWSQGRITAWDGLTLNCFLPVLYPGSFSSSEDAVRMGRSTVWADVGRSTVRASGQHVFDMGDRDVSLLEIREMLFSPPGDRPETDHREPAVEKELS